MSSVAQHPEGTMRATETASDPRTTGRVAEQLVALLGPRTFYDAGCGTGLLVRAMADLGVDARGGDFSADAIEGAPVGLAERLEVRDLTQAFGERYDLITCISVLEQMPAPAAREAVVNLCAATDVIVMSSAPAEFADPASLNVRPPSHWAQDFAGRGFFRRTDIDASFVAPWAVVYQRGAPTAVQVVGSYESLLAPLSLEVVAKRQALLDARQDLSAAMAPVNAAVEEARAERDLVVAERDSLLARVDQLGLVDLDLERMNRLAMADELIGTRAELALVKVQAESAVVEAGREVVRLREVLVATKTDLESATSHAVLLEREVRDVRASLTWRIGWKFMMPVRIVRRPVGLARRVARKVGRILTR